jgi:DNA-binding MarR family transcriptional regulator
MTAPRDDGSLGLGALQQVLGFHLARAQAHAVGSFERHVGTPLGLRKVDFSLLMLLAANGPVVPKQLARALAVTAPKLTLLVDGLAARGLVRRERNPADGRSQHVVLTDKGHRLAAKAAAAATPMEQDMLSRLTRAEHAMLIELLDKLAPG